MGDEQKKAAPARTGLDCATVFSPPFVAWVPLFSLLLIAVLACFLLISVVDETVAKEYVVDDTGAKECEVKVTVVEKSVPNKCVMEKSLLEQKNMKTPTIDQPLARLKWSISVLLFGFTIIVTVLTIFSVIRNIVRSTELRNWVFIVFVVAAVVILILLYESQNFQFNESLLGLTVYDIKKVVPSIVASIQICGIVTLVVLAIAVSLVLSRAYHDSNLPKVGELTEASAGACLAESYQSAYNLLYVGALVLVAGTIEASFLYSWAISMLEPYSATSLTPPKHPLTYYWSAELNNIPQVMGMLNGSFYSILLAAIFVPALFQLQGVTNRLFNVEVQKKIEPALSRKEWLEKNAVDASFPRQLLTMFVVLSPMLAGGPLATIFGMIT